MLSPGVISKTRDLLPGLIGVQLGGVLQLYTRHAVHDYDTVQEVAKLLKSENAFIANKAYQFLMALPLKYDGLARILEDFKEAK